MFLVSPSKRIIDISSGYLQKDEIEMTGTDDLWIYLELFEKKDYLVVD